MSAPILSECLAELHDLQMTLEGEGQEQTVYGPCCVEDPRDFSPDPECATDEEVARWRADCARVAAGSKKETQTRCYSPQTEPGTTLQIMPSGYGLGVNTTPGDETAKDVAERLLRIIGMLELWREEHLSDEERDT